jgi:acyl dehydratase
MALVDDSVRDSTSLSNHRQESPVKIGDTASRTRTITTRDIKLFTAISGDRNPLHYDPEVAEATRFGGIIVQGGVTSGLLNAVVAEDLPGPGSVFLNVDWSFLAPVRPGDEITATVEVIDIRVDKPIVRLQTQIRNQDGVAVLDGSALVWREPLRSSSPDALHTVSKPRRADRRTVAPVPTSTPV